MKKLILIIYPFIFLTSQSQGQIEQETLSEKSNGLGYNLISDADSFLETSTGLINSPFRFDETDFILTGIIISATAFSLTFDNPVRNKMMKIQSPELDKISRWGENFGNGTYLLGVSSVMYIGGHLFDDDEIRKTGLMLSEAIILNGIVTTGLKVITGRSRPFRNNGNTDIDFFKMEFDDVENSLPSGHTSTAFAVATVLSNRINNTFATIGLYSIASLTAFQRMYADKHWLSDVILGAALGTVIGLKVISLNSEEDISDTNIKFNVAPVVSSNGYGVGLILNF